MIDMKEGDCYRCYGDGRIANDEDKTAWVHWLALPPESQTAMRLGLVQPVPCPDCKGTGKRRIA